MVESVLLCVVGQDAQANKQRKTFNGIFFQINSTRHIAKSPHIPPGLMNELKI